MYDFATGNAKFSLKKPKDDGAKGTTGGQGANGTENSTGILEPKPSKKKTDEY